MLDGHNAYLVLAAAEASAPLLAFAARFTTGMYVCIHMYIFTQVSVFVSVFVSVSAPVSVCVCVCVCVCIGIQPVAFGVSFLQSQIPINTPVL